MCTRIITVLLFVFVASVASLFGQATLASSIFPHYATGEDSLLQPGESFWLDIKVDSVSDLFGTSFELNHDTTYLDLVSADSIIAGDFLGGNLVFTNHVSSGKIAIGVSRKSGAGNVGGSGTVARVKFFLMESAPVFSSLHFYLTDVVSTDSAGTDVTLNPVDYYAWIDGIQVWPGDADNSGLVDQSDVLPLGIYWALTGSVRQNASRLWEAQSCFPWTPEVATYADCDGSGKINQADLLPIGVNWHKSHATLLASSTNSPKAPTTMLNLNALKLRAEVNEQNKGEYVLFVELVDSYLDQVRGVSFIATANDVNIISAEKGDAWSKDALYFQHLTDGTLAVGATEIPLSSLQDAENIVLAKIFFTAPEGEFEKLPVELSDIKLSLADGRIVSIASPAGIGSGGPAQVSLPKAFSLTQNSPNPFNPSTTINYSIPEGQNLNVRLAVFDTRGRKVVTLFDGLRAEGDYSVVWNGEDNYGRKVSSGVYFYRLEAGKYISTRKMVLLK